MHNDLSSFAQKICIPAHPWLKGVSLGTLPHAAKHAAREATNFGVKRVRSPIYIYIF